MTTESDSAPSDSTPLVGTRGVDIVVSLLLLGVASIMAYDNWRAGAGWAADGPEAGYFPFYLSLVLGAASLYGLGSVLVSRPSAGHAFVTRDQFRRVMQVFVPTLLFCVLTQWLGLYVASLLLISGFMWIVGRIALWKSLLTGLIFSIAMFVTFEIAFNVIMPKGPLEAAFGF